ncbi:DUF6795 domain-containing protein [Photobacterium atrarenae]|uniref:DUF6795 domain-containing protein n=1 Tax=Photobacterium atrarenae TaxID=865757 RepID=A0ABY5GEF3_9GAMM|nr:DUF6795 domain-containing protein [Photobacterium atrarenae]UTV27571.1 hypothetical protein NNL38_14925 [Photobacterium atrarenae]
MNLVKLTLVSFSLTISMSSYSNMFDFFKRNDYILSPRISGNIYKDASPQSNYNIYLEASFLKIRYEYATRTDERGNFDFDEVVHSTWIKTNPLNQTYSYIGIYTINNNKKNYIWQSQFDYEKPLDFIVENFKLLKCNLNSPEYKFYFENSVPDGVDLMVLSKCELSGYKTKE